MIVVQIPCIENNKEILEDAEVVVHVAKKPKEKQEKQHACPKLESKRKKARPDE